jgi:hypothetical protein
LSRYARAKGVRMTKISPIDFKPELVSMMKTVLEKASAYIDNAFGQARRISDRGEDSVAHHCDRRRWRHRCRQIVLGRD